MATKFRTSSGNVFQDIGFDKAEAHDLRLRADLMMALRERIAARGQSQTAIAGILGVTQPRVSDLLRGQIHLFSFETLVNMLSKLGATVDVSIRVDAPPKSERTIQRENDTFVVDTFTNVGERMVAATISTGAISPVETLADLLRGTTIQNTEDYVLLQDSSIQEEAERRLSANTQLALAS